MIWEFVGCVFAICLSIVIIAATVELVVWAYRDIKNDK